MKYFISSDQKDLLNILCKGEHVYVNLEMTINSNDIYYTLWDYVLHVDKIKYYNYFKNLKKINVERIRKKK